MVAGVAFFHFFELVTLCFSNSQWNEDNKGASGLCIFFAFFFFFGKGQLSISMRIPDMLENRWNTEEKSEKSPRVADKVHVSVTALELISTAF